MELCDLTAEHRHQAAVETMRAADPDCASIMLKEYFGAGSSGWTTWDEQFVTFIETHRRTGLKPQVPSSAGRLPPHSPAS